MAVDTAPKRSSCLSWNHRIGRPPYYAPSASELGTQAGRQHNGTIYVGILAAGPVNITSFDGVCTALTMTGVGH